MISLKKYMPQTLLGRSILIVILPVVLLQIFTVHMFFERHWSRMTSRLAFAVAGEINVIVQSIESSPNPDMTLDAIHSYMAKNLDMIIKFEAGETLQPVTEPATYLMQMVIDTLAESLRTKLQKPFSVRMIKDGDRVEIKVQMSRGVLRVECLQRRLYSSSSYIFLLWMIGSSILLTVIAALFMRNQIRPIRKLAAAAGRFGRGLDAENFKPEGAREVRQAARAFIDMRDRIRRQVDQRTAMLAGVSHDLRTPLTRLKLGLSLIPETSDTTALRDDIQTMEKMMNAYLEFARGEGQEKPIATDITELLGRVLEGFERSGFVVESRIEPSLYITLRPVAFERAVSNILTNARKYARQKVSLIAQLDEYDLVIVVADDGPGIAPEKFDDVFKPFVRLDPARSLDDGGVGLGLSIALDIIQTHGGMIELGKSSELGGLSVTIRLPR
jgi:two-component system, OmpR family, osmolarity sensor histidine kinase EnvZ